VPGAVSRKTVVSRGEREEGGRRRRMWEKP